MENYIWLIPFVPLMGFLSLGLAGRKLSKGLVSFIGVGTVVISSVLTIIASIQFINYPPESGNYVSVLYNWITAGDFTVNISLVFDPLSLIFCFVITFVGALIHLYSVEFMSGDENFARFFAFMNLFVGSMLVLVLAGNLLLLYLGWEGVGLCSYLLIGFWYKEPANADAANKAFIVTRIGDTAMIIGIILLFVSFGTLDINDLMKQAHGKLVPGSPLAVISCLLLLAGALGKSAQLPLQVWLPDAMAGPSPVSALIHAATMVTAGVYLITRTHVLFTLAPVVMIIIAVIGTITLLVSGFSALAQTDLKRILAYSTISQIGYMFVAMGIGAWTAGVFHFVTHAFFKALLFLAGGAVIHLLNDEHNIYRMGGLRKKMPLIFYTFLAGAASLAALPLVTAGFYSKDEILWFEYSGGGIVLWIAGVIGTLLTSVYIFRLVFMVFYGKEKVSPSRKSGWAINISIITLAILSITGGFIEMPQNLGPVHLISRLFGGSLPQLIINNEASEFFVQITSALLALTGIYIAWKVFYKDSPAHARFMNSDLNRLFLHGWGFDKVYEVLIVMPTIWIAKINRNDIINSLNDLVIKITSFFNRQLSRTQNGNVRWYVMGITLGILIILTFIISQ